MKILQESCFPKHLFKISSGTSSQKLCLGTTVDPDFTLDWKALQCLGTLQPILNSGLNDIYELCEQGRET